MNNQRKHAGLLQRWVRLSAADYEAMPLSCGR